MAVINYPANSPYATTPQIYWRMGRYEHRPILPQHNDTFITVEPKYHNRPDRLSHDLYGTPNLWWVFMLRNMDLIRDPIWDLKAGMRIAVPSTDSLKKVL
jgi:hypothetical protein